MEILLLKALFILGFISIWIIRYPHLKRAKETRTTENRQTPLERNLLAGLFMGMRVLPLIYVFTPFLGFADYRLPFWASAVAGTICFVVALWLFQKSHHDLGDNWSRSLEVRENHRLVTEGIYKTIRHPMYTSIWFWAAAQALLLHNWIGGLAGLVSFGLLYFLRVGEEEQMMLDQFGDEYRAYMQRTGRIFPKFS